MPASFIDSNVLIYATSEDVFKAQRAEALIGRLPTISVQVLNEFANVSRRKLRKSWAEIAAALNDLTPFFRILPVTREVHVEGLRLADRYDLYWWDALIVAAALSGNCDTLYSEDMRAGLVIDGTLTIVNPFA